MKSGPAFEAGPFLAGGREGHALAATEVDPGINHLERASSDHPFVLGSA